MADGDDDAALAAALAERERAVDAAIRANTPLVALKASLEAPPLASKDTSLKERNYGLVLRALQAVAAKEEHLNNFFSSLDADHAGASRPGRTRCRRSFAHNTHTHTHTHTHCRRSFVFLTTHTHTHTPLGRRRFDEVRDAGPRHAHALCLAAESAWVACGARGDGLPRVCFLALRNHPALSARNNQIPTTPFPPKQALHRRP
jgi:hypothetical protein